MKIVGHRGARGLAPENTIIGFKKAISCGVDEVELDVRITKDGRVALTHDPRLKNSSGREMSVDQHTFAQLQRHKPDLTSLEKAIESIGRRVPIYIDIKPGVSTEPIVTIVKHYLEQGWKSEDFRLGSYSQPILRTLQVELPNIQRIIIEDWSGLRAVWRARQVKTRRISMLEYWLWPGFIAAMNRRGYELYSFPPKDPVKERRWSKIGLTGFTNTPAKARKWSRYGLRGVITDYPDRFER